MTYVVGILEELMQGTTSNLGSSDIWSDDVPPKRKLPNILYIWIITNKCTIMNSSFLY